jgi:hypothetical protein
VRYIYVGPVRLIATSTSLTALLVSPVAFLHLKFSDRPRLAMAFLSNGAAKAQSVITETYKELDVIVPEWLREHSAELLKNQKRAIDLGAVLDTDVDALTVDYFDLGWAFQNPPHSCYHMNIPPVRREQLHLEHPNYVPLSLTERNGFVVAGAFAVPVRESFALPAERIRKNLEIDWPCFKKYRKELSTYIDSAERYTGSLIMILCAYHYNLTSTNQRTGAS